MLFETLELLLGPRSERVEVKLLETRVRQKY